MKDQGPIIEWTPGKLKRFKKAFRQAELTQRATFMFEGHLLVVDYARYLIEYLDAQFAYAKALQARARRLGISGE